MACERRKSRRRPQLRYFCILSQGQQSWPAEGYKHHQPWAVFVRRFFYTTSAALILASPLTSLAQTSDSNGPQNLTLLQGNTLNEAFYGRTMDGTYKGVRERTGTSAFTESFFKDGTTDYREGKLHERGRWQLSGAPGFEDVICFRYQGKMAGPPSCFTVFREGTCLYSYSPGMVRNGKPLNNNYWQAKTVIRGELSSCDDLVS